MMNVTQNFLSSFIALGDRISDKEPLADLKAWIHALEGRQATESNPVLVKFVGRALCLSCTSTSPCERDFGNILRSFQKRLASPLLKEMHLRLSLLTEEPGRRHEVIKRAMAIWREGFKPGRLSGHQRRGNFVSRMIMEKKRRATWI